MGYLTSGSIEFKKASYFSQVSLDNASLNKINFEYSSNILKCQNFSGDFSIYPQVKIIFIQKFPFHLFFLLLFKQKIIESSKS